jgi:hypothetical protein
MEQRQRVNTGITLKNVKKYKALSQETEAFSASVYIGGKRIGEVSNDGWGGSHRWDIDRAGREAVEAAVDAWITATGDAAVERWDSAVEEVLEVMELQKIAKKNAREGYPVTLYGREGLLPWAAEVGMRVYKNEWSLGLRDESEVQVALARYTPDEYEIVWGAR